MVGTGPRLPGYQRLVLSGGGEDLTITFEPAGGTHTLRAGQSLFVLARGQKDEDELELFPSGDTIAIWPSAGMSVKIFDHVGAPIEVLGYS